MIKRLQFIILYSITLYLQSHVTRKSNIRKCVEICIMNAAMRWDMVDVEGKEARILSCCTVKYRDFFPQIHEDLDDNKFLRHFPFGFIWTHHWTISFENISQLYTYSNPDINETFPVLNYIHLNLVVTI